VRRRLEPVAGFLLVAVGLVLLVSVPVMLLAAIWGRSWQWFATAPVAGLVGAALIALGDALL
jgi:hypothetical protein